MHAEPILKDFEKQTGIKVKAVYDSEAVKSVGLVNRLRAEAKHPQADVFWNNEMARSMQLAKDGVTEKPKFFAARARVLVYNTQLVKPEEAPQSVFDLTAPKWRGKVAMAYPLFGTTATHAAMLFATLGENASRRYYESLKANDVRLFEGNSIACEQVAQGQCLVGITDTDDFWERKSNGSPIEMIYPDQQAAKDANPLGCAIIPNALALTKKCPHLENARKLMEFLLSREVEQKLAFGPSHQIPMLADDIPVPPGTKGLAELKVMSLDYDALPDTLALATASLEKIFSR